MKQGIFSWYAKRMGYQGSSSLPTVAIIGAGFSGTCVALHLIAQATYPLRILLIERSPFLGQGVAYATKNPFHFLNVPANQMGVWANDPQHFYHWISHQSHDWQTLDPALALLPLTETTYLPRLLYGRYLKDLLEGIQKEAERKQIILDCLQEEAMAIERNCQNELIIHLKANKQVAVNAVVLATGVPDTKRLSLAIPDHPNYIADCWSSTHPLLVDSDLRELSPDAVVFMMGTGLTMVDMCMGLWQRNYPGKIIALSPLGRLPESHQEASSPYPTFNQQTKPFKKATQLLKALRLEITKASQKGYQWRQVIDGLRHQISDLWQPLSVIEKRRFLRLAFGLWNKHRHRMAPFCAEWMTKQQELENLKVISGRLIEVNASLELMYWDKQERENRTQNCDYLLNCLGPDYQLSKTSQPLMQQLHAQGVVHYDSLGMGLQTQAHYQLKGAWSKQLYALGALLFGEKFETTSVPELREQANSIAEELVKTLR